MSSHENENLSFFSALFESFLMKLWAPVMNFLKQSVPPGPAFIPMNWIINFQKGGTCCWVWFLMNYYYRFHWTAWIYLANHGTYGILWLLKDAIFPDKQFSYKVTAISGALSIILVLGPYWLFAYFLCSNHVMVSPAVGAIAIAVHTLGCVLMMASDAQKFYTLKYKKGLIDDGWFAVCRNTNYLGEMMLYGSYALLSQNWISWAILIYIWTLVFFTNMYNKERSLRKKKGWKAYRARSGMLFPWVFSTKA